MIALENSKLFADLSPKELHSLKQLAQTKSFDAGQPVFKEGDPGDGVYVIGEGRIQISAIMSQDQQRTLSRLGPGEFFGEMAVLDNEPRSASATAEEPSQLIFIPRDGLLELLEHSPKLAFSLVRQFSLRMRDFNRQYVREVLQSERLTLVGRFARSIVHDFKNPLAIIGLAAELGTTETASREMRELSKSRVRKQIDRLSNMINELLEFTRGSQSSIVLALTDFDHFIQQLLEDVSSEVAAKSVTIVCENPPPPVRLLLDPRRLAHAFQNLVNNAVDAMPGGGRILLRFTRTDGELVTELEDTGPGFNPQILGRLFEPFATYGKAHGTGLGLSICQRIIQDHRGRIQAQSEPGRGAIFAIALPLPVS